MIQTLLYLILSTLFTVSQHTIQHKKSLDKVMASPGLASRQAPAEDTSKFDFINYGLNEIREEQRLASFFQKLKLLQNQKLQQVRIAHIGDSHIQADFFPGKLRFLFQESFGNAGRGLVFPYQQAGTHSPIDSKSKSANKWENKRSVFKKSGPSIGISGMSIRTYQPFNIDHYMKERYEKLEQFDRITIFHPDSDHLFSLKIRTAEEDIPATRQALYSSFQLESPVSDFSLLGSRASTDQKYMTIHGMLLEKSSERGILYNMMGVNGTTYYHFNRCEYLMPQLQALGPDLIIISLGTNEALLSKFSASSFESEASRLVEKLRKEMPDAAILITTLPDAYIKSKYENKNGQPARAILVDLAQSNGCAYWDLYNIMGGHGSMKQWVESGLGFKDYIHFTREGYEQQAEMLFNAIQNSFTRFDQ